MLRDIRKYFMRKKNSKLVKNNSKKAWNILIEFNVVYWFFVYIFKTFIPRKIYNLLILRFGIIGLENRSRGNSTGGSNPPLSATLSMTYLLTSPLLFLNRTIVEYSWRVRSSLFSVRYCDIQHLIRYGSDRKLSSENVQLFSRFLIAHHYSFRHSSYETAAKLVVGTEVA